jgi:D-alanyl-D-alanine dipeptidase
LRLLVALIAIAACSHEKASEPLPYSPTSGFMLDATDLVTAVADEWTSTKVTLARWRRANIDAAWTREGEPWQGVIGTTGLAWGDGLHGTGAPAGHDGPVKHEGDRKSPAGAFRITNAFGYDDYTAAVHYIHLTDATECVDDPSSASYNTILEGAGSADWTSSEHMRRTDDLYSLGAVVAHNPNNIRGDGSCIFLHVWSGPDSTTVGCTAMARDKLDTLLRWLGTHPVLVQLPRAEYRALQHEWGLPPQ